MPTYAGEISTPEQLDAKIDETIGNPDLPVPDHITNLSHSYGIERITVGIALAIPNLRIVNTKSIVWANLPRTLTQYANVFRIEDHAFRPIPAAGDLNAWDADDPAPADALFVMPNAPLTREEVAKVAWSMNFSRAMPDGRRNGDIPAWLTYLYNCTQRMAGGQGGIPVAPPAGGGAIPATPPTPAPTRIVVQLPDRESKDTVVRISSDLESAIKMKQCDPSSIGKDQFFSIFLGYLSQLDNGAFTMFWDSSGQFCIDPIGCTLSKDDNAALRRCVINSENSVPFDAPYRAAYPTHTMGDWKQARFEAAKATPAWAILAGRSLANESDYTHFPLGKVDVKKFHQVHTKFDIIL